MERASRVAPESIMKACQGPQGTVCTVREQEGLEGGPKQATPLSPAPNLTVEAGVGRPDLLVNTKDLLVMGDQLRS